MQIEDAEWTGDDGDGRTLLSLNVEFRARRLILFKIRIRVSNTTCAIGSVISPGLSRLQWILRCLSVILSNIAFSHLFVSLMLYHVLIKS